jgi:peptide/nickel transport system ATP-binding protein
MAELMIDAKDVTRNFTISRGMFRGKQQLKAVNGVDLTVERGEVLALVGESGCGKTTLAKVLLGLLPQTSGTVELCGQPINDVPRLALARTIQPIFQDPYSSLNPRKTIGSIIALPMKVQGIADQDSMRRRVEETMDLVGLPPRLYDAFPNQLSGGQRQRVAIARALVNRPQIVVCDEPTSALDVSVQSQILNLLNDLRNELNLTYIIISHNLAVVEHIATRVAVMYLGRIVEIADTDTLFKDPQHPYTRALVGFGAYPGSKYGHSE